MDADKTAALSSGYRSRKIDETSHPDDWMFAGYVNGMADYLVVGVCGARVVHAALTVSPTEQAHRPREFGLRALREVESPGLLRVDGLRSCVLVPSTGGISRVNPPGNPSARNSETRTS
jgi:hypothetical protein